MGVINVTPDSFSDGGSHLQAQAAIATARRMLQEGAAVVDVGGESTRPGAQPVTVDEELRRVVPVLEGLVGTPVSIDTAKATVARRTIELGAALVNDVTGLRGDPDLAAVVAEAGVLVCLMHMQGEPRTMQVAPRYDDVVAEVTAFFEERIAFAVGEGIAEERILIDPGFGFGKTPEHNLALLANLGALRTLGRPVLLGTSRKSTLGRLLDVPADQRVEATVATTVLGVKAGVDVVRVHDVRANARAARVADAVARGWRPDGWPGAAP
jgi:dihydropteroate synthase